MTRTRPVNELNFRQLIDQTRDEVVDYRAAIKYDEEYIGDTIVFIEPVLAE